MPEKSEAAAIAGGCGALIFIVAGYLAIIGLIVWFVATIVHGVFF